MLDLVERPDETQRSWLHQLERRAERGLAEWAEAIAEIRQRKLYAAAGHSTFEAYCRERWGKSVRRIQQILAAGEVLKNLQEAGVTEMPQNERQVRELTHLSAAGQRVAWQIRQSGSTEGLDALPEDERKKLRLDSKKAEPVRASRADLLSKIRVRLVELRSLVTRLDEAELLTRLETFLSFFRRHFDNGSADTRS